MLKVDCSCISLLSRWYIPWNGPCSLTLPCSIPFSVHLLSSPFSPLSFLFSFSLFQCPTQAPVFHCLPCSLQEVSFAATNTVFCCLDQPWLQFYSPLLTYCMQFCASLIFPFFLKHEAPCITLHDSSSLLPSSLSPSLPLCLSVFTCAVLPFFMICYPLKKLKIMFLIVIFEGNSSTWFPSPFVFVEYLWRKR